MDAFQLCVTERGAANTRRADKTKNETCFAVAALPVVGLQKLLRCRVFVHTKEAVCVFLACWKRSRWRCSRGKPQLLRRLSRDRDRSCEYVYKSDCLEYRRGESSRGNHRTLSCHYRATSGRSWRCWMI